MGLCYPALSLHWQMLRHHSQSVVMSATNRTRSTPEHGFRISQTAARYRDLFQCYWLPNACKKLDKCGANLKEAIKIKRAWQQSRCRKIVTLVTVGSSVFSRSQHFLGLHSRLFTGETLTYQVASCSGNMTNCWVEFPADSLSLVSPVVLCTTQLLREATWNPWWLLSIPLLL